MIHLFHINALGGNRFKRPLEKNVDAIEDDHDDITRFPDSLNFRNISLLNGLDGIFGLA